MILLKNIIYVLILIRIANVIELKSYTIENMHTKS